MKKFIIILLLTILTILPTFATNWVKLNEKQYIDADSIEQYVDDYGNTIPNQYTIWTKNLNDGGYKFKEIERDYNIRIWYLLVQYVIDIDRKRIATKNFVVYDLKGAVIVALNEKSDLLDWGPLVPNSIGHLYYRTILFKNAVEQHMEMSN